MTSKPMPATSGRRSRQVDRPVAAELDLPPTHVGRIDESHERCRVLGLSRIERPDHAPLGRPDLGLVRDRNHRLMSHAAPVMEMLFEQIVCTGSMVVLTDDTGTIIHSLGAGDFLERASRVALAPGVNWSEQAKGTNAIGTALIEEAPTLVHADEHYLHANHFLTCSAVPIFDPRGNVLGALDVTGDHRSYHQHTMALVKMSARMIENHWLADDHRQAMRLHFHDRPECLGSLMEGIVAVGPDGRVVGANRSAMDLLGLSGAALRMNSSTSLFGLSVGALADHFRNLLAQPLRVHDAQGRPFHMRVRLDWPVWNRIGMAPALADTGGTPPLPDPTAGGGARAVGAPIGRRDGAPEPAGQPGATRAESPRADQPGAGTLPGHIAETITGTPATTPLGPIAGALPGAPGEPTLAALQTGDARMQAVVTKVKRVLDRGIPILILGETGTGKELLARAIHHDSLRRERPFVAVNCASIPEALIESELFGYEEGAFTGARRKGAVGRIVQADGGTLFLDEIGDMPLALQAHLLRVLQERRVTPLGSTRSIPVDLAVVCATHRPLREMIDGGHFRDDLYYRLNGLALRLPPLRERSDLAALVRRILEADPATRHLRLAAPVQALFARCRWPGNVRQLANVLRTAAAMAGRDPVILSDHLPDDFLDEVLAEPEPLSRAADGASDQASAAGDRVGGTAAQRAGGQGDASDARLREPEVVPLETLEIEAIRRAVEAAGGNISDASKRLGISRNTIYRKLRWSSRASA